MRRTLAAALVTGALLLTGCVESGDETGPVPGPPAVDVDTSELRAMKRRAGVEDCVPGDGARVEGGFPELSLPCLGGGSAVDLATLEGPMVVNLWQAFCGPCRKEMPALQEFHERHGDRVPVLGIDYLDVQPVAALELVRETGVTYPLLADAGGELNRRDGFAPIRGLPYLLFLRADGTVEVVPGGVDSVDELVGLVDEHLGVAL